MSPINPRRSGLLAVPLLALVFAGCVTDEDPTTGLTVADPLDPDLLRSLIVLDHDHSDRAAHAGAHGLGLLGHASGYTGETPNGASFNEIAAHGDLVFLSRGAPAGGFAVIDIADPAHPKVIGEWAGEPGFDIEVTHDGKYVLFATQRNNLPLGFPGSMTEAPREHLPRGLFVVDVSDPTAPAFTSYWPHPYNGVHTMEYRLDDKTGTEFVVIQTYDLGSSLVPRVVPGAPAAAPPVGIMPASQRVTVAELDRSAIEGPAIRPLGVYQVHEPVEGSDWLQDPLWFPHDSHVERHPVTDRLLLYVAYWDAGMRIVDIEDPSKPTEIAKVTEFPPSALVALHDVKTAPQLIDGRHITVTGPEIVSASETGQFTVFDTTDPTNPVRLGHWTLPG
ncbi:MAG: hypothetical protein KY455_06840, partial [Euryarchaeota archaeon]|nr:hypothetical protein [Euryarchaeota archaeon]